MSGGSDYVVIESEALGQKIAYDKKSGRLYCEDRTVYSADELFRLGFNRNAEIPQSVHLVKKIFGGEIVFVPYNFRGRNWNCL